MAGFNFAELLNDPAFRYGVTLLGNSRSADPFGRAQEALTQMETLKQQRAKATAEAEALKLRQNFDLTKYRTPAREAVPAQPIGVGAFAEPRMTEPQAAQPGQIDWMGAATDFVKAGGDLGDMAAFKHYMTDPAAKAKYAPLGGGGAINLETGEMVRDPQAQADKLEILNDKQAAAAQMAQLIAGLKPTPTAPESIVQSPEGIFRVPRGGQPEQLRVPGTGVPLTKTPTGLTAKALNLGRPPAEISRMTLAYSSLGKGLDALEAELNGFDPRSIKDQFNPTKRASINSLSGDLLMMGKEAAALGALQQADLRLMEQTLTNPTSTKGAVYGKEGIKAQIAQVRKAITRRKDAMAIQYPNAFNPGQAPNTNNNLDALLNKYPAKK